MPSTVLGPRAGADTALRVNSERDSTALKILRKVHRRIPKMQRRFTEDFMEKGMLVLNLKRGYIFC